MVTRQAASRHSRKEADAGVWITAGVSLVPFIGEQTRSGRIGISLTTLLLCVAALVAALTLGPSGLDTSLEKAVEKAVVPGLVCGAAACLMAVWVRGQWTAGLVVFLAIASAALAGPTIGFMFLFGLMTGLGALFALIGSWDDAGIDGVALQLAGLLLLAALMLSFFVSQAWAVMRAWTAWKRAATQ